MKKIRFMVLAGALFACGGRTNQNNPQQKQLMEAVYASGFVVSKNEYQVFAQAEGYIVGAVPPEGTEVKKGDVIFLLESQQQNARYRMAKEAYDMASHNYRNGSPVLSELDAAIRSATTKVRYDSNNFVRYNNLVKQNATSRADYDRMKLVLENSRNDLLLCRSRYDKVKNQLFLELKNAENQWKIASEESGRYSVRSEINGRVYKTLKEKGELVRRNEAVAVLGSGDSFYARLSVDEMDIRKVKEGQDIVLKIDAFGDQVFQATVSKVHPLVDSRDQSLRVDADFTKPLIGGFSGLAVEANIVIQKKERALVIPKSLLLSGDSVFIQTKDGNRKVKIKKGIETLDEVEVLEGLTAENVLLVKN
jgi:multidrug resistance efflux pump